MMRFVLLVCLGRAWAQTATPQPTAAPPDAVAQMKAAMEKQRAAILQQRQAAARQAEFASKYRWSPPLAVTPFAVTPFDVAETAACTPLEDAVLTPLLESASKRQGVALNVLRAVARQESGFRPCAVSPKGAKGLMQLMPATAAQLSVRDPFDPEENMQAGARYLKELLGRYNGNLKLALAAYNAGPNNVTEAGGVPDFPETQNYVAAILQAVEAAPAATPPPEAQ